MQMTVLRTDIEKALDKLISNEEGMRFQSLAVVLAMHKRPISFCSFCSLANTASNALIVGSQFPVVFCVSTKAGLQVVGIPPRQASAPDANAQKEHHPD